MNAKLTNSTRWQYYSAPLPYTEPE